MGKHLRRCTSCRQNRSEILRIKNRCALQNLALVSGLVTLAAWWFWFAFNPLNPPPVAPFIAIGLAVIALLIEC